MNHPITEIEIKYLNQNDLQHFQKLIHLFHQVFETNNAENANETYLANLLAKKEFIAIIALYENAVVGGLTAYEMPSYYGGYSEVYIYDIAIKPEFQRNGIGKKLISALKEYCSKNGIKEVFVEAHDDDKHAIDFYQSMGGVAEKVVHFNFNPNYAIDGEE